MKKCGHKKKSYFLSLGHSHIFLAFLVWFHGTLDRLKSLLVKKWYNDIAARDESPLISRSLSNPLFNCTVQALWVNRAQPMRKPSHDITGMQCGRWMRRSQKKLQKHSNRSRSSTLLSLFAAMISRIGLRVASGQRSCLRGRNTVALYGYFRIRKP